MVQGGETWGFGRLWRLLGRCILGEDRRAPRDHPRAGQLRFLGSVVVVRIVVGSAFAIAWNVITVLRLDVVLVAGILGTVLRLELVIVAGIVPCLVVVMAVIIKFSRASFLALCRLEGNIVV